MRVVLIVYTLYIFKKNYSKLYESLMVVARVQSYALSSCVYTLYSPEGCPPLKRERPSSVSVVAAAATATATVGTV